MPVPVDQADERHRGVAESSGEVDDVVEAALGRRVEDGEGGQRGEAVAVLDGERAGEIDVHRASSRSVTADEGGFSRSGSLASTATIRPPGA